MNCLTNIDALDNIIIEMRNEMEITEKYDKVMTQMTNVRQDWDIIHEYQYLPHGDTLFAITYSEYNEIIREVSIGTGGQEFYSYDDERNMDF